MEVYGRGRLRATGGHHVRGTVRILPAMLNSIGGGGGGGSTMRTGGGGAKTGASGIGTTNSDGVGGAHGEIGAAGHAGAIGAGWIGVHCGLTPGKRFLPEPYQPFPSLVAEPPLQTHMLSESW
jgi:hypothetical protein